MIDSSENKFRKKLNVNIRNDKVYNAGLVASVDNGQSTAKCYFCGYIDGQVRIDVSENGGSRNILIQGTRTVIEMAGCLIEIKVKNTSSDFILVDGRVIKIMVEKNTCQNIKSYENVIEADE